MAGDKVHNKITNWSSLHFHLFTYKAQINTTRVDHATRVGLGQSDALFLVDCHWSVKGLAAQGPQSCCRKGSFMIVYSALLPDMGLP